MSDEIMRDELPMGWHVLELAEERARQALAAWDCREETGLAARVARGGVLAETMRKLLAELATERRLSAEMRASRG